MAQPEAARRRQKSGSVRSGENRVNPYQGTPGGDAAIRTRDFVASRADRIGFINVALFNLPVASAEVPRLETRAFYEGDLSLYRAFVHPGGWNRDAVRAFLAEEFNADPAIKTILARTPPVFTSNHAPFFLPSTRTYAVEPQNTPRARRTTL